MNRNSLIALAAITLTVVIAAVVVVSKERAPTSLRSETLLPRLAADINDAAAIDLSSNRHRTLLERDGETWRIANSDDYPSSFDKVRNLLINLSELRTQERKTNNPDLYHRLHVQDPSEPDSKSVQVTVRDHDGGILADIIIGKARISKVTNTQTGLYVRKPDAEHALLVEGRAPVSAEKTDWFNPDILSIASERVREVVIDHPDNATLRVARDKPGGGFDIDNLPADRRIQSRTALNRFGAVLQDVSARDIRALGSFDFGPDTVTTTLRTFDGLVAEIRSVQVDDRHYANFRFRHDADGVSAAAETLAPATDSEAGLLPGEETESLPALSPQAEADDLQKRLGNWVYLIPAFKYETLTSTIDDHTRVIGD